MATRRAQYRIIYEELQEQIKSGKLKAGEKVPTEKELSERYKVSRITSKKAMDLAAENNLITRMPGKGSFVTGNAKRKSQGDIQNKAPVIAVIQPELSEFFGLQFYKELELTAHEQGVYLIHGISNKCIEKEKSLIRSYIEFGVDGFIIQPVHYETFSNEILKLILEAYPLVLIDRSLKDISCTNVVSDNVAAGMKAIDHLFSLGHRNIGIASRPVEACSSLKDRLKGVQDYYMEKEVPFKKDSLFIALDGLDDKQDLTFQEHKERIREYLTKNREITAIFSLEYSPVPIIQIVAAEMGLRIPEDLSLISFDNPGHLIKKLNPVTHIRQREKEIARTAYSMIDMMIRGEKPENPQNIIETDLVICHSTSRTEG
ncbi:MAG: GntR family transcriptional regulator [Spirochaetales bacterium]|nr:GntR family transcriptional regulator [Spirochaetales bacterium]